MTAAATIPSQATPGDPPAWERLDAQAIFEAGNRDNHPDGPITEADLDGAVRHFNELYDRIKPTAWAGHEDDYLNTGLPAFGMPVRVWRDGKRLFAEIDYVPPEVAAAIKAKRYPTVSAEFYKPGDRRTGVNGYVLKHVAFLGAHQPAWKGQPGVGDPAPSGSRGWPSVCKALGRKFTEDGTVRCFSEFVPMKTRAELESLLKELGYTDEDVTLYKALPDDALAGFVARQQARDQERKAAAAKNEAAAREAAAKEAAAKAAQAGGGTAPVPTPADVAEVVRQFSEVRAALTAQQGALAAQAAQMASVRQFQEQVAAEGRRAKNEPLVKAVIDAGYPPALFEKGHGPGLLLLERLNPIRKFAEGDPRSEPSEHELMVALLKKLAEHPIRRFGDQLPDPVDAGGFADLDKQVDAYAARRNGKAVN